MLALAWASAHVCIAATLGPATTWGTFTSTTSDTTFDSHSLGPATTWETFTSTTSDTTFDSHRCKQD